VTNEVEVRLVALMRGWMWLAGFGGSQGEGAIIVGEQVEGLFKAREGCRS
jgi:hypothetical protein